MDNLAQNKAFEAERKNTDDSLVAERDKASHSVQLAQSESQDKTDATVLVERNQTDLKTARSRAAHDSGRPGGAPGSVSEEADALLHKERQRSDAAVGLERTRIDAAILKEREISKKAVDQVLELERKVTDRNLLCERDKTDDLIEGSTNELKSELADHARTKSSLTTRDEFLAIVSHDLRNPVGAILSYSELLTEGFDGEHLGPQSLRAIATIKRNAVASLRLIEDLIDVERISHDKLELRKVSTSAKKLLEDTVDTYLPRALAAGLTLDIKPSNGDVMINCDRDRILQVLGNLIGNAIKYTPRGEVVRISKVIVADSVTFKVCDTGPGIPLNRQVQIFERFAQLKSLNREGLGLGLYISKMLVEAHGGSIDIESAVGEGTTFTFTLPLS